MVAFHQLSVILLKKLSYTGATLDAFLFFLNGKDDYMKVSLISLCQMPFGPYFSLISLCIPHSYKWARVTCFSFVTW
jgi:hypothetical protein